MDFQVLTILLGQRTQRRPLRMEYPPGLIFSVCSFNSWRWPWRRESDLLRRTFRYHQWFFVCLFVFIISVYLQSKLQKSVTVFLKIGIGVGWVVKWGFPGGTTSKEPACQYRRHKRHRFDPSFGKTPWETAWQPTPVFLPGESHGQGSLVGYSPWGCKELDTTKVT